MSIFDKVKVTIIDTGDRVYCDMCNKDFTVSTESGGLLFVTQGVGPCCAGRIEKSAIKYNEAHHIRARCPTNMSFSDWIRNVIR
jgi:hypothetical protein